MAFAQALINSPSWAVLQARFTVAVDTSRWSAMTAMLEPVSFRQAAMTAWERPA